MASISVQAVLQRKGGTATQGRPVKFHLWLVSEDGTGTVHNVEINSIMWPVDPEVLAEAEREAAERAHEVGDSFGQNSEFMIRFFAHALRDPEQPQSRLILAKDLHMFRRGSTVQLLQALSREYLTMIRTEYPETVTGKDFDGMVTEAGNFTGDGQTGSGPS